MNSYPICCRTSKSIWDIKSEIGNRKSPISWRLIMTMQIDWLRGCATALVTPFTSDGAVDVENLRALIEHQISGGIRLLVPCGTTGESATMTDKEDQLVIRTTVEVARGRAKVIAGTGSNSTAVAIEYSQTARELGVDAVLSVAPYYNKPTQEGLVAH